jgi:hypothetical protein
MNTPSAPPAGWYPDPAGGPNPRWWDGRQWAAEAAPAVQQAAFPSAGYAGATPPYAPATPLRAPAGTGPYTPWIFVLVLLPMLALIPMFLIDWRGYFAEAVTPSSGTGPSSPFDLSTDPAYLAAVGLGLVLNLLSILWGYLDWRALTARGVPRPFHWAFIFFALIGYAIVYVIGRIVVTRQRTGSGLAVLWTLIGTWVLSIIVVIVVFAGAFSAMAASF